MKKLKIVLYILLCITGFALIRLFEEEWFYDPFLTYYKGNYQQLPFPEFNSVQLFLSLTLRYLLNTALSLGVIYALFKNKEFLKVASVLYLIFFALLIISFFIVVNLADNNYNFMLFYIRRFLIQPLFLLLFIPGFYFQKKQS